MGTHHNDDFLLRSYLRDIESFGLITPDQEVELAGKIANGDDDAREMMIKANLRLVITIAREYDDMGVSFIDLINIGNTGLMKAVERFDPEKGAKFSTYAAWWIKQAIKRELSNSGLTIRIPVHLAQNVSRLDKFRDKFRIDNGRLPNDDEVYEKLGLDAGKVDVARGIRNGRLSLDYEYDDDGRSLIDLLPDESAENPFDEKDIGDQILILRELVEGLSPRDKEIIQLRFGLTGIDPMTLEKIGDHYCLTRERIRQLLQVAIGKLRTRLENRNRVVDKQMPHPQKR